MKAIVYVLGLVCSANIVFAQGGETPDKQACESDRAACDVKNDRAIPDGVREIARPLGGSFNSTLKAIDGRLDQMHDVYIKGNGTQRVETQMKAVKVYFTEVDDEVRVFRSMNGSPESQIFYHRLQGTNARLDPALFNAVLISSNDAPGTYSFRIEHRNLPNPGRNNPSYLNCKILKVPSDDYQESEAAILINHLVYNQGSRSEEAFTMSHVFFLTKE